MPAPGPPVPPLLGQTEQSIGEATCFSRGRQPGPPCWVGPLSRLGVQFRLCPLRAPSAPSAAWGGGT